jgi:AcrR family transcriptional regulator
MATQDSPSPRTRITREQVLRAAVELADSDGVAALSMRKIAQRLGVEAMSLYHHVANKDDILDGMVDAVFAEIALPDPATDWRTAMRRRAESARAALLRHRWAVGLMDSRRNPGPATVRHHDAVLGSMRRDGFSVGLAAHAFSAIDSYLFGFVLQEVALPFEGSDELGEIADAILEQVPRAEFPYLTEMIVDHALQPGYDYADEFAYGLELVLDGLQRDLEREGPPQPDG